MNEMKWIPVKERLPKEDGKIIVTENWISHGVTAIMFYSKNIKEWVDNNISVNENPFEYWDEDNKEIEDISNLSGFFEIIDVMTDNGWVQIVKISKKISAWMPYPEPYKKED